MESRVKIVLAIVASALLLCNDAALAISTVTTYKADLAPRKLEFKEVCAEFTPECWQEAMIHVTNIGNAVLFPKFPFKVLVGDTIYDAVPIGPTGVRYSPIGSGQTGLIHVRRVSTPLKACECTVVHIDTAQNNQSGPGVFANDRATLPAFDGANPTLLCTMCSLYGDTRPTR